MSIVMDWGAMNPLLGIQAGVAGAVNAWKANASQSRLLQFKADQQRNANIASGINSALTPLAFGLGGAMLQRGGYEVNPAAMMMVGAGINPAQVGPGAFGPYSSDAQNARYGQQFMSQQGITPQQADTLGNQILNAPDDIRIPQLRAVGFNTDPTPDELPQARRMLGMRMATQIGGEQQIMLRQQLAQAQADQEMIQGLGTVWTPAAPYAQEINSLQDTMRTTGQQLQKNPNDPRLRAKYAASASAFRNAVTSLPKDKMQPMKPPPLKEAIEEIRPGVLGWRDDKGNPHVYEQKNQSQTAEPKTYRTPEGVEYLWDGNSWNKTGVTSVPSFAESAKFRELASKIKVPGPKDALGNATEVPLPLETQLKLGDLMFDREVIKRQMAMKSLSEMEAVKQIDKINKDIASIMPVIQQQQGQASPGVMDITRRIGDSFRANPGNIDKAVRDSNKIIDNNEAGLSESDRLDLKRKVQEFAQGNSPSHPRQQPSERPSGLTGKPTVLVPPNGPFPHFVKENLYSFNGRPGLFEFTGNDAKGEPQFEQVAE